MDEWIGLNDMDGNPIHVGDVVEFYFDEYLGLSKVPDKRFTRMRDLVVKEGDDFYFLCAYGAAYVWRYNEYCRVIGRDKSLVDT